MLDINVLIPVVGLWILAGNIFALMWVLDLKKGEARRMWKKDRVDFILLFIANVVFWPKLLPKKQPESNKITKIEETKNDKNKTTKTKKHQNRF